MASQPASEPSFKCFILPFRLVLRVECIEQKKDAILLYSFVYLTFIHKINRNSNIRYRFCVLTLPVVGFGPITNFTFQIETKADVPILNVY